MTRDENLLFALLAFRVGILTRDQLLAVCGSLRAGGDIDLGKSLIKRNLLDEWQSDALWNLTSGRINACGTAMAAMEAAQPGDQLLAALQGAVQRLSKAPRVPSTPPRPSDPPTIKFDDEVPPAR
ncbi:MAG: hypothetical protein HUU15_10850 [Candidatus Brocadiae bacterium]|nr:hypothetical protein [Candidatus Brocadiia bacterium]